MWEQDFDQKQAAAHQRTQRLTCNSARRVPVALCANYVQAFSLDTVLFCGALNPNLACGLVQIVNVLKRFVRPLRLFNHLRFAVDRIGVDRTIRRSCQCSGNRGSPGRRPVQKGEKGENGCASGLRQLRCKINQATEPD